MTSHPNLSERDLELLSAYLDGELSDRDRHMLEQRLAAEADLRRSLDELRATVRLVGSLPRLKAPRNFTLDPAQFQRPAPWWQRLFASGMALQLTGALGTAASIILIVLGLALSGQETPSLQDAAPSATLSEAPAAASLPTTLPATPTLAPSPPMPLMADEADGIEADAAEAEEAQESTAELAPEVMLAPPGAPGETATNAETFAAPEAFMAPDDAAPAQASAPSPEVELFGAPAETLRAGQSAADSAAPAEPSIAAQAPGPFPMPTGTVPMPEEGVVERFAGADDATDLALKETAEAESTEGAPPTNALTASEQDESTARPWLIGLGAAGLVISVLLVVFGRRQAGA